MKKSEWLVKLGELRQEPNSQFYLLIGQSLRNLLLANPEDNLKIIVPNEPDKELVQKYPDFRFLTQASYDEFYEEDYTIDTLSIPLHNYLDRKTNFKSSCLTGLDDFVRKKVRFVGRNTKKKYDNPNFILDAIELTVKHDFKLDRSIIKLIFKKREQIKTVKPRKLLRFLFNTFVATKKKKQFVRILNTYGISMALFDTFLVEHDLISYLRKNDFNIFLFLVLNNIPSEFLETVIKDKIGMNQKEYDAFCKITKYLNPVENFETANEIYKSFDNKELWSILRYYRLMRFSLIRDELTKIRRNDRSRIPLAISWEVIMNTFGCTEEEGHKMLDMARNRVILDPRTNVHSDLLIFLNKETKRERSKNR